MRKHTAAWKKMMRECRLRYARTPKGRFQHLYSSAKQRGIALHITLEDLMRIQDCAECFYCKGPLPLSGHGLDRLDSRKAYTTRNVVPCCSGCNRKKGRLEGIGFKFPRTVQLMLELKRR